MPESFEFPEFIPHQENTEKEIGDKLHEKNPKEHESTERSWLKELRRGVVISLVAPFLTNCGIKVMPETPFDFELIQKEVNHLITPTLLQEAGIDPSREADVKNELAHMFGVISQDGARKAVFAVNRSMIKNGIKVYYEGTMKGYNVKSLPNVSLDEEYAAIQEGLSGFSTMTGLSVVNVPTPEEANAILESIELTDVRATTESAHIAQNYTYDKGALNKTGKNIFFHENIGAPFPFTDIKNPHLRNDVQAEVDKKIYLLSREKLVAHELGHSFGYNRHSTNPKNIMYPKLDITVRTSRPNERADVNIPGYGPLSLYNETESPNDGDVFRLAKLLVEKGL